MNPEMKREDDVTILVVDDHPMNLRVLLDSLQEEGFRILIARNGEGALRQATLALPDIILLDVMMPPGIDGFETCRRLKQQDATKDIPVIFMTALSDTINKVTGFEVGGVDYVTKPFDRAELLARVKAHLALQRYQRELAITNQKLRQMNEALLESQKQLEIAARTDPLTHLSNRRDMIEKIEMEKVRIKRHHKPFTLILCDIDNFKMFNDTFGHDCGDFILVSIANMMRAMIREQDQLARWGGEEFLFLLPETNLKSGAIVAEKIRKAIADYHFEYKTHVLSVTMTFGVSICQTHTIDIDDCIKQADRALYNGKHAGKNLVFQTKQAAVD
ncbi:response regulator receiver modulated diguanylate cyclase [Candidatus Vecturithrix granuli]|uniref:Response regulator receiver modulated diguanylate cyclase n=1 Tax=Vecturithrix granuli TaxID=1499967 RepID=A0A081BTU7_VECG1|nr:response regulator receiver modulated diguanylate cyclase [Candidatus Vecturithrix granuli]